MFENIKERIAMSLVKPSVKRKPISPFDLMSFHTANMPIYSELTVRRATREGYRLSIFVYRAVRTIVQAASGIPWYVEKDGEPVENHPFTTTWARPNKQFSGQDNMEFLIAHLKLVGNSLLQPVIINGLPREFWVVMPDMVKPIPSNQAGEWLKGWEVQTGDGKTFVVPPEQFVHFMQFDPGNPYWGIGDLQSAARTVDTDNEAQDTQKVQLQNRSVPPGVFQFDQTLNDEQFEEASQRVREKFLQKNKRGEPWVLGGGYKWQQMSLTPVEMDFISSRLSNKRDIAAAFGLDPWWVGDREHSTYNNVSEARKALYEDVVIPLLDDVAFTLNLRIAPMYGDDITIKYDLSNVSAMREDFGKKTDQASKLWAMGVPFEQINSKLELGFEEFEGWETGYLPFSVMPTGGSGNREQETEPVKMLTKSLNLETEEQKSAHWKRIDRRRLVWANTLQKRYAKLYGKEGQAVVDAIGGEKSAKFTPDSLSQSAKKAIDKLKAEWLALIAASSSALIEDFGGVVATDIGTTFNTSGAAVRNWIKEHAAENVKSILETNLDDVRRVILKGVDDGLTRPQIASKLRDFYDDRSTYKAMRVARTETAQAAGFGQREVASQSGVANKKQWLSSRDSRVRDSHIAIDGELRNFDEPYSNGLMYPGDPSGDLEETIMCRCVEGYTTE